MFQEDNFQFWEDIYLDNDAGWDLGRVTPVFESIAQEMNKGKLCIVGCGCGYDVIMFAKQGFDVTAVDFAPFPVQAIRRMALGSSLWFPLDKHIDEGGPPYGTTIGEVKSVFNIGWEIEKEEFPDLSIEPRKSREKLIIFKKTNEIKYV